eukprot:scaffold4992_cov63-Phaeocystis_antarctica.AAC.2
MSARVYASRPLLQSQLYDDIKDADTRSFCLHSKPKSVIWASRPVEVNFHGNIRMALLALGVGIMPLENACS